MNLSLFILIGLAIVLSPAAHAQEVQCYNDPTGKRGFTSDAFNKSLTNSRDPLAIAFKGTQILNLEAPTPAPSTMLKKEEFCLSCLFYSKNSSGPVATTSKKEIQKIAKKLSTPQIKKECIYPSLERGIANVGYLCGDKAEITTRLSFNDKQTPCLDERMVDYLAYSLSQAMDCISPDDDPIDPRFILKKINNETGFNFFMAYKGGVGIGQLTSDPVKDIAGEFKEIANNKTGKTRMKFIPGRGVGYLKDIMESNKPSCKPLKKVVAPDLIAPPPFPGNSANYCHWVSVGDGITRSLIYGLSYYVFSRDKGIKAEIAKRAPELLQNKELVNNLTLVAYGPGGMAQAKTIISGLNLTNKTDLSNIQKRIEEKSKYVKQTNKKMAELLYLKSPEVYEMSPTKSIRRIDKKPMDEDLKGNQCITNN